MKVPARIAWAVEHLAPAPDATVLELGCGPGVAAALLAERLPDGRLLAVDRSAVAVSRTRERTAAHGERVEVRQAEIADLAAEPARFEAVLAIHVNVFWTDPDGPEAAVVAGLLADDGAVHLVWEGPSPEKAARSAATAAGALERAGLEVEHVEGGSPGAPIRCVVGRRVTMGA